MSLIRQIKKAWNSPDEIFPYFIGKFKTRRRWINGELFHEYQGELYPHYLTQGNAQNYIRDKALEYCKGDGIDVGASEWPLPGAKAVQERRRQNALLMDDIPPASLDYVFSSHCLEHIGPWQDALRLWTTKIKAGGVIFIYVPHRDMKLWHPGGPWAGPSHKWQPTWEALDEFLRSLGFTVIDVNKGRDRYWSFHIAARRNEAAVKSLP